MVLLGPLMPDDVDAASFLEHDSECVYLTVSLSCLVVLGSYQQYSGMHAALVSAGGH